MENKQLYNIEDDVLIILSPENFELTVKSDFTQSYFLQVFEFTILYYLSITHPNAVEFKDFKHILNDLGLEYPGKKSFIIQMNNFKNTLKSYGVKNIIVKIKDYGYIISNKWVAPELHTKVQRKQRLISHAKLLTPISSYTKS